MPEYLYPGVYVEEIDTGNKPIEGVSTSTVGFLGIAERGPVKPTLVTSFDEFTRSFGRYLHDGEGDHYLAFAVEGFFQNGGKRCYVQRVFHFDDTTPANSAARAKAAISGVMNIWALGPGGFGNNIAYQVSNAGLDPGGSSQLFRLSFFYWVGGIPSPMFAPNSNNFAVQPTLIEVYDNLSPNPNDSTFYEGEINDVSNLIVIKQSATGRPAINPGSVGTDLNGNQLFLNGAGVPIALTGGGDGTSSGGGKLFNTDDFTGRPADPTLPNAFTGASQVKTGLEGLGDVDEISLLCCPDESYLPANTIAQLLVSQCENKKDRFAILQAPVAVVAPNDPSVNSKYAAYYYPWLKILDPRTSVPTLIPPGGHVAGIYARSDTNVGVHKDPANEVILGIEELQVQTNDQQQAILNPKGVNVLRYFRGAGNLVWGGRTTASDPDWKYINVRRLFIFVEKSIQRGTQWVVFDLNSEPTWARVVRSVGAFLTGLWRDGMLQGAKKEEAFFVRCDRTTMTQADIDNGRLICLIGIAPVKPAEFVIFRIGQWDGGSSVTEG
jgi:phage tail sheath protein FI